jgi:phasin family protein
MSDQKTTTSDTTTASAPTVSGTHEKHAGPDIAGILEKFKLPGFDLDSFVQSRKNDIDAVTQATSAAFSGAQTIVDKQTELLKTVLTEVGNALRTVPQDAAKPAEFVRKQQELANEALSSALASIKEIAETVRESQSKVLEIASNRVRSSVEEIRRSAKLPPDNEAK